jgi:hypothetical protein
MPMTGGQGTLGRLGSSLLPCVGLSILGARFGSPATSLERGFCNR